ncbi:MAG: carbohydrate porin [Bacteroidota bacterium]
MLKAVFFTGSLVLALSAAGHAQSPTAAQGDSGRHAQTAPSSWTSHFQATVIAQKHSAFKAKYSGANSLADSAEPYALSLTSTLFLGRRLWKGGAFYLNPEVSGGKGLSFAKGVAGALNGETYRVGTAEPKIFIGRAYYQQHIRLFNSAYSSVSDGVNQIADQVPQSRITISAGKFAVSDFFDNNSYSKDTRTQFFNWSAWANGAWDYPANTRGYTMGLVTEFFTPGWSARFATVAVPRKANGSVMEYSQKAHSETFEIAHDLKMGNRPGAVRLLVYSNSTRSPSYADAINALKNHDITLLNVVAGNAEGKAKTRRKLGIGLNFEQELGTDIGVFSRIGWNDGKNATWAFTEIDRTINAGISVKGTGWNRADDVFGLCGIMNGLSGPHRRFLQAGGYGFIIGDGALNYAPEQIIEAFYSARLTAFFRLSLDYQFVRNPAYNHDRGPVNVVAVRGHVSF